MKLVGLISPNLSEDTLIDVYEVFPPDIRIEGRTLKVGKYTDDEFHRAELAFADLVRDLARQPLDFLSFLDHVERKDVLVSLVHVVFQLGREF